jgi:hypothetical protein
MNSLRYYYYFINIIKVLPSGVSLTADNWFGLIPWMEFHTKYPLTMSIPDTELNGLLDLFASDLKKGEYRTFSNGKILLTVFQDEGTVKTASTCFKLDGYDSSVATSEQQRETNTTSPSLQLSEDAINILQTLPQVDLKKLAVALAKPSSKYYFHSVI